MDPLTAALNLASQVTVVIGKFLDGATPEQKAQLIQFYIDDQKWWRGLIDRLKPQA